TSCLPVLYVQKTTTDTYADPISKKNINIAISIILEFCISVSNNCQKDIRLETEILHGSLASVEPSSSLLVYVRKSESLFERSWRVLIRTLPRTHCSDQKRPIPKRKGTTS